MSKLGKVKQYNKGSAAVLGGALIAVLSAFVTMDQALLDALQVVVVAALVVFVPNGEKEE